MSKHANRMATARCRHCRRSRRMALMERDPNSDGYRCRDEVDCSEATQWSEG